MPLTPFIKIEISERMQPVIFLAFTVWLVSFDVIDNTPGYRAATFLPQWIWIAVFSGAALFQLIATHLRRRDLRRAALFVSTVIWFVWSALLSSVNYRSFGPIIYFSAAVTAFWTFARIKK